jgi:uncharacterized protein (DUF2267 family)
MNAGRFYSAVARSSHEQDGVAVKRVSAAVLRALRDRLTMDEADQVFAQLPRELKAVWGEGEEAERAPVKMDRAAFLERIMREAELPSLRQARWMTVAVFAALKEQVSPGEARDVMSQLPKDLKELWAEAQSEV